MVVLSIAKYTRICDFITKYKGLTIDCDRDLRSKFPDIEPQTLSAVLSKEWQKRIKKHHHNIVQMAPNLLKRYVKYHTNCPQVFLANCQFYAYFKDFVMKHKKNQTIHTFFCGSLETNDSHLCHCAASCWPPNIQILPNPCAKKC